MAGLSAEHGPNCAGWLKIIAAILERPVIEKILTYLGLQTRAPPQAPARGSQLQAGLCGSLRSFHLPAALTVMLKRLASAVTGAEEALISERVSGVVRARG